MLTRHLIAIVWSLQQGADHFELVFDLQICEGAEREYVDSEMCAHGFTTGINMQCNSWESLFESKCGPA